MKKLLDEKGKLFGKINIIDLAVILVIVVALIFAAVRLRGGSAGNPLYASTKIRYTAKVGPIDDATYQEVLRHLEANGGRDQLMADGALVDGYVVGVEATRHMNYESNSNGVIKVSPDPEENGRWDLTFIIEANVPDPTTSKVGTQEVRVGKTHIVKTAHFEFPHCVIQTCLWGEEAEAAANAAANPSDGADEVPGPDDVLDVDIPASADAAA